MKKKRKYVIQKDLDRAKEIAIRNKRDKIDDVSNAQDYDEEVIQTKKIDKKYLTDINNFFKNLGGNDLGDLSEVDYIETMRLIDLWKKEDIHKQNHQKMLNLTFDFLSIWISESLFSTYCKAMVFDKKNDLKTGKDVMEIDEMQNLSLMLNSYLLKVDGVNPSMEFKDALEIYNMAINNYCAKREISLINNPKNNFIKSVIDNVASELKNIKPKEEIKGTESIFPEVAEVIHKYDISFFEDKKSLLTEVLSLENFEKEKFLDFCIDKNIDKKLCESYLQLFLKIGIDDQKLDLFKTANFDSYKLLHIRFLDFEDNETFALVQKFKEFNTSNYHITEIMALKDLGIFVNDFKTYNDSSVGPLVFESEGLIISPTYFGSISEYLNIQKIDRGYSNLGTLEIKPEESIFRTYEDIDIKSNILKPSIFSKNLQQNFVNQEIIDLMILQNRRMEMVDCKLMRFDVDKIFEKNKNFIEESNNYYDNISLKNDIEFNISEALYLVNERSI